MSRERSLNWGRPTIVPQRYAPSGPQAIEARGGGAAFLQVSLILAGVAARDVDGHDMSFPWSFYIRKNSNLATEGASLCDCHRPGGVKDHSLRLQPWEN